MSTARQHDDRAFDRFSLEPMYTSVTVQRVRQMTMQTVEGHVYDISEAGVRVEIDEPLEPGECVSLCIHLPGETDGILVNGTTVWRHDALDDPGPRRVAIRFTTFVSARGRARLARHLGSRVVRRSA